MLKSLRYLNLAISTLIPKRERHEIKLQSRYFTLTEKNFRLGMMRSVRAKTDDQDAVNEEEDFYSDLTDGFFSDNDSDLIDDMFSVKLEKNSSRVNSPRKINHR
jgi:hypothetical protein